ncbi:hypothetical protein L211DRAFT_230054 [Terfezia boudieri ATCC MYA-4762]|uniref:EKC/KEOPS complex subunit BUD32 n=1 Tax=Terfezia boudieri ATCC MYA-4762 TaxID=1051890 RepID=A0A3N4LQX6_9PEZI|nr:hypothetical protein L211DRAFT_230054 [Terfezia boudieri ATCC MYA-4762]
MQCTRQIPAMRSLPPETASRLITAKSLLRQATTEPLHDMILKNLVNEVQHHYNSFITSLQSQVIQLQTQNAHLSNEAAKVQAIYATCNSTLNPLQNIVTELTSITETFHEYAQLPSNPALKSTRTRAQVWTEAESHPNTRANLEVPTQHSTGTTPLLHTADQIAASLALLSPAHGANNYAQATTILETFFGQQTTFGPTYGLDTHSHRFLDDLSPDICIQRSASSMDKFNVALVLDIKNSHLSTSANKGQILDYLYSLASCQPGRRTFLGILTDFKSAELIKIVVGMAKTRRRRISDHLADTTILVTHYRSQPLSDILKLAYAELAAPEANPRKLSLSSQSGTLVKVLQLSPHTVVAVVRTPTRATNSVVKAALDAQGALDISREAELLASLQHSRKPWSIPSLLYSLPSEFAIQPVGRAFRLEEFRNTRDLRAALRDIVYALEWVHKHNLVHRDVRTDNLVLVHDHTDSARSFHAVLIDFDRSATIGQTTTYEGGYICCPEELLQKLRSNAQSHLNQNNDTPGADPGTPMSISLEAIVEPVHPASQAPLDLITYEPHPKHDFLAFVILLNQLLFPFTFQRYAYHLIEKVNTKEQRRLLDLWSSLKGSKVWGPIVQWAEGVEADGRATRDWDVWLEMVVLL